MADLKRSQSIDFDIDQQSIEMVFIKIDSHPHL